MAASASTLPTAFISFRHRLRQPPLLLNHTLRTLQISATGGERPQPPPLLLHQHRPSFDAFLSFHGALRHTIVDHLYASLLRKGVKAFKDDTQMERGVEVKQAISAAIGDSSIYLLLLSPGYASSSFCMDEAVEIMKSCDGGGGRVALPVFYLVTPEDVCLPTAGCFKEQFQAHFADFTYARVQGWIDALSAIGEIAGFVHNNGR
ncbi:unnamed protein product [Linum tenue]|uniref:TIR domain-containing protein n=1 Tax=Linum tenue TaxID=586396 RepID=A0AAV0PYG4_9ROSI|nr:unnamed protein product [Linum tenue]